MITQYCSILSLIRHTRCFPCYFMARAMNDMFAVFILSHRLSPPPNPSPTCAIYGHVNDFVGQTDPHVSWIMVSNAGVVWNRIKCYGVSNHQPHHCLPKAQIKENMKAPRHWPLCWEFTDDLWIPRTKGQQHGKCFHMMTSSWFHVISKLCSTLRAKDIVQRTCLRR